MSDDFIPKIYKIYIVNLGCKLNNFEGQAIVTDLRQKGHYICDSEEEADIVIVNTCTVTAKADDKGLKYMRRAKNKGKKVIATGCYATTDALELAEESYIDLILRNEQKFNMSDFFSLLDLEEKLVAGKNDTDFPQVLGFERTRAFLKIQDGCNKFCSFCKIPFARGRSRSQNPEKVFKAFELLLEKGYKEIVLTGINLSDYQSDQETLGSLVNKLLDFDGEFRIRLSSLQPDEFDPLLFESLKHPKMCPHFHLSVQSGSDSVLQRMFRHYSCKDFLQLVDSIRNIRCDTAITTDIIVGFPDETECEFQETLEMVKKAEFSRVHIFPYSSRKGTIASQIADLPNKLKQEREKELRKIYQETALKFANNYCLGQTYQALTETAKNRIREAYTENYIKVKFNEKDTDTNQFISIKPSSSNIDIDGNLVFQY